MCSCFILVCLQISLKFATAVLIKFFVYFCIPASISFYVFSSFLCLSFLGETNHCLIFLSCLYLFYFDAFFYISSLYSLVLVWLRFLICNKNINFNFIICYFVFFCIAGITCSPFLYSSSAGLFPIISFLLLNFLNLYLSSL